MFDISLSAAKDPTDAHIYGSLHYSPSIYPSIQPTGRLLVRTGNEAYNIIYNFRHNRHDAEYRSEDIVVFAVVLGGIGRVC